VIRFAGLGGAGWWEWDLCDVVALTQPRFGFRLWRFRDLEMVSLNFLVFRVSLVPAIVLAASSSVRLAGRF
jgi:hypothetical protein